MKNSHGVLEGNYVLGSLRQAAGRTGLRGIDWMWKKVGSGTPVVAFPIYDGHGNMVYTLSRGANETFSLGNKRIYGAWGDLRYDGNPNAGPNTQYCANLGHKKDNESSLTYMRARYYEPWTGRFVSEDPALHGGNWFVYASNDPVNRVDPKGQFPIHCLLAGFAGGVLAVFQTAVIALNTPGAQDVQQAIIISFIAGFAGGAIASVGFWGAGAIGGAIESFVNRIMTDFMQGGLSAINWGAAVRAAGFGGAFGAALAAVGRIYGKSLEGAAELPELVNFFEGVGGVSGGLVGGALDSAVENW